MVIPSCVGIAIWAVRATATRYSLLPLTTVRILTLTTLQAFFLATWKRKSSTLAFRWDVQDFSEEEPIARRSVRRRRRGGGRRATTKWAAVTHREPRTARHSLTTHHVTAHRVTAQVGAGFMPLGERDAAPRAARPPLRDGVDGHRLLHGRRHHRYVRDPGVPGAPPSRSSSPSTKALVDTFVPVAADDAGSGGNGTADDGSSLAETLVGYVSPSLAAMCVASGLNLVFIVIFNVIYRYVAALAGAGHSCCGVGPSCSQLYPPLASAQVRGARPHRLGEPPHRVGTEVYIIKSFSFQAVNSWCSLWNPRWSRLSMPPLITLRYISFFYIAFVRSQHLQLFGMEYEASSGEILPLRDSCSTSSWSGERRENDCMGDLFIQMVIVVLGKEVTRRARHGRHHHRHRHLQLTHHPHPSPSRCSATSTTWWCLGSCTR